VIVEPGTGYATVGARRKLMKPEENDRVAAYGPLSERAQGIFEQNTRLMDGPEAPKPQDEADAIARRVHTPPGERPQRTPLDEARSGCSGRSTPRPSRCRPRRSGARGSATC
jgi:hypothetical protein